jgi:polyphosphate kinase
MAKKSSGDRLPRTVYEEELYRLQVELVKLQEWTRASGARIVIIFECRDAAGKGGTIRRFTENLNPRGARIVALEKPAAHEQGDNYLRRYLPHLPAPGEIVMFDRSWYNRAGVEQVMGFCQPEEYSRFLRDVPGFERGLVNDGITVVKFWFSVTRAEQLRRFIDRQVDPVKRWKLSPVDLASLDKWDEYTRAKEAMFAHTDLPEAPWTVVKSNNKRRARVEAMRYVLSLVDYCDKRHDIVGQPDPLIAGPVRALAELPAEFAPATPEPVMPVPLSRISPPGERVARRLPRSIRLTGPDPAPAGLADGALLTLQTDTG